GVAKVTLNTHTLAGTATTVTATDSKQRVGTMSVPVTTVPGPVAQVAAYAGADQTAMVGTAVGTPPSVVVRDAYGNPIRGTGVYDKNTGAAGRVLTWSKSDANGAFSAPTSTTDDNGSATITFTTHTVAGTSVVVTATDNDSPTPKVGTSATIVTVLSVPTAPS